MLLHGADLDTDRQAIVLAASKQSYKEADIATALQTTFKENLYKMSRKGQKGAFVAERDMDKALENAERVFRRGSPRRAGNRCAPSLRDI